MTWRLGEKALFRLWEPGEGPTPLRVFHNTAVTIVSPAIVSDAYVGGVGHEVCFSTGLVRDVGDVCLHPLPPQTNQFEAGEWELCPWRPERVTCE